jgi:hypothetical protein
MNLPNIKPHTLYGRVQRLFGVYVPPKKIFKAKRYVTLRYVVVGVIPSKKNDFHTENNVRFVIKDALAKFGISQKAFTYIKDNTKSWIRGSKRYLEWVELVKDNIHAQSLFWAEKYNIVYPLDFVSIKTYYFFADKMARDFHNKDEAVYDMLVKLGVISDDNYGVLFKTSSDGGCYASEIKESICTIDITLSIF